MNAFLTMITGATEGPSDAIASSTTTEDRSHPNLRTLDSLHLSYPGFERDRREVEAIHFGNAKKNLGFDAAIRRLRVKQRAYEEQRSIKTLNRSHPNLVALDALELTYPGWEKDVAKVEKIYSSDSSNFGDVIHRLQIRELRHQNDRSHYRLQEIDQLKLSYPGWKADIRTLEKFHFENASFLEQGDSLFQSKLDGLKRRQQIYLRSMKIRGNRSFLRYGSEGNYDEEEQPEEEALATEMEKEEDERDGAAFFHDDNDVEEAEILALSSKGSYLSSKGSYLSSKGSYAGSYAALLGSRTHEEEPQLENIHALDDDRADLEPIRGPYPVFAAVSGGDTTPSVDDRVGIQEEEKEEQEEAGSAVIPTSRVPEDPPRRPDPPEQEFLKRNRHKRREQIDCDATTVQVRGGTDDSSRNSIDDGSVSMSENDDRSTQPPMPWASKLSSYLDPEPIAERIAESIVAMAENDNEASDEVERSSVVQDEEKDEIFDLPTTANRKYSHRYTKYRGPRNRPRGNYSAPSLIPANEEEQSAISQTMSEISQSSSHAVAFDDRSTAAVSQSSSQAVWADEQSVASATSSGAVFTELAVTPCLETPSSTRAVNLSPYVRLNDSTPEMPRRPPRAPSRKGKTHRPRDPPPNEKSNRERSLDSESEERTPSSRSKKKSPKGRVKKNRKSSDDISRKSKESRASSHGSSRSKKLGRCTICGDTDKNHVFVPCGHLCACKECAGQVISRNMACPVCRGKVTEAIQVFL